MFTKYEKPKQILASLPCNFENHFYNVVWVFFSIFVLRFSASLGYFSLILGPLATMFFINKYGRKTNLRLILLLFAVGWTVILVSSNFANLIVGLTLCGVASGKHNGRRGRGGGEGCRLTHYHFLTSNTILLLGENFLPQCTRVIPHVSFQKNSDSRLIGQRTKSKT